MEEESKSTSLYGHISRKLIVLSIFGISLSIISNEKIHRAWHIYYVSQLYSYMISVRLGRHRMSDGEIFGIVRQNFWHRMSDGDHVCL